MSINLWRKRRFLMKKYKKICAIGLASILLCACSGNDSSSSSDSFEESSSVGKSETSSSSSEQTESKWSAELQTLMKQYCGEVLPYPEGMLSGEVSFKVAKGTNGEDILQITDESDSFTLGDYYEMLEDNNWYAIRGYNNNPERRSNDKPFYELTKSNAKVGYDLSYTFRDADESSTDSHPSGNVILCYNNLTTDLADATTWNENDLETMKKAITVSLPFFKMGINYVSHQSSEDVLLMYDYSTIDLRESALVALEDDGYVIEAQLSKVYNMHILRKFLADGSFISVSLSYTNGNYFQFGYSANPQVSTTWPSSILENIENSSGITVPSFTAPDITKYYSYDKNGKVYIYAETQTNIEYDTNYYSLLEEAGIYGDGWGNFATWDETVSLNASILYNYEGQIAVQYAFCILVQLTTPTSNFSNSWPSEAISSFLNEKSINVTCPTPTNIGSSEQVKYQTAKDEKNRDILRVQVLDKDASSYKKMASFFENEAYFDGVNDDSELYFEDPTGALRLTFRRENGVTIIDIGSGSKTKHTPVFSFVETEMSIGRGSSSQLHLNVSMLPYEITFSSNDEEGMVTVDKNGLVTVSSDATIGKEVTITASLKAPNEENARVVTCVIKVVERTPYTTLTAMNELVKRLNAYLALTDTKDALYTCYNKDEDYYYVLHNFVGSSWKLETIQQIVADNLLLEEYTLKTNWTKSTSSHGNPMYTCQYSGDGMTVEYSITINNTIILFEMRTFVEE